MSVHADGVLGWNEVATGAARLANRWSKRIESGEITSVFGVPRGGVPVALLVRETAALPIVEYPSLHTLIVDDLIDSGATAARWFERGLAYFDALYRKPHSPTEFAPYAEQVDRWLVFPWESTDEVPAEDGVIRLLEAIGENPNRDGLRDTPGRVVRALREMTAGMAEDPAEILATTFDGDGHESMVVLRQIEFTSLCEHHLLPFSGTADVGYIAQGRVVGISKLARLVECYARRPQLQERMTDQIADALQKYLQPKGVGVVVRAHHSCMGCRGVRKPSAEMVTSSLRDYILDMDRARMEFLGLAG